METDSKQQLISSIAACFDSKDPLGDIHRTLKLIIEAGYERGQMIADLQEYMLALRQERKEREEHLVLDGLSFLVGWCAPSIKI